MIKVEDSHKAFVQKIKALYDIESEIKKALPKMEKAARDPKLKEGFKMHLEETKLQIDRLEQIFELLGVKKGKLKCEGIRGIIADGEWVIKEVEAPDMVNDAMLAGVARYVEHYEMAGYMSAVEEAKMLGLKDVTVLLTETLTEEKEADKKLAASMKELSK